MEGKASIFQSIICKYEIDKSCENTAHPNSLSSINPIDLVHIHVGVLVLYSLAFSMVMICFKFLVFLDTCHFGFLNGLWMCAMFKTLTCP